MTGRLRASVALGSGGARGYAHIGALQVLAERDIEVVALAGTSMGALVGAVAAAGHLPAYTEWSLSLTQREVLRLLDLSLLAPGGMIRAEKIIAKVADLLGDSQIEDLPIPFTAVATDLTARREVWFQHGPAITAIRASIAIPGIITPVVLDGRTLVDGGLMNPVPIEPMASVESDLTVAVSLTGARSQIPTAPAKETATGTFEEWAAKIKRSTTEVLESERIRSLASRLGSRKQSEPAEIAEAVHLAPTAAHRGSSEEAVLGQANIRTFDLLNMSFETMSALVSRYRMAATPPDVLVTVPSNAVFTLDFHRAAEMIELGRTLTIEALDRAGY